jgi:hypothetical protein
MTYTTPQITAIGRISSIILGLAPPGIQDSPCDATMFGTVIQDCHSELEAEW